MKQDTFVSPTQSYAYGIKETRTKKYIYKFFRDINNSFTNRLAGVKNHPRFDDVRNIMINLLWTSFVFGFVLFSIQKSNPIWLRGPGFAVLIALIQYYVKSYYRIKVKPWS